MSVPAYAADNSLIWLSASDLAKARLPGLPESRENAARFISRVAAAQPEQVRPRAGRGGGLEVSIEALPLAARRELARRAHAEAEQTADVIDLAAEHEANKRQITVRAIGHLTARQRRVMEARAAVLLAIDATGLGRSKAVANFVFNLDAGTASPNVAQIVARANDRPCSGGRPRISRATIYGWFKAREELGLAGLAPAVTRQKADLPPWFDDFLRHYAKPTKPSVAEALRDYNKTLPAGAARPTEAAVRRCLKKMPQLERLKGREGKLTLRARLAYTARDTSDLLPTSVYVADGKTYPAEIAHPIHGQPFRPELSTIEDVATRRIVGWSASLDENTFGVIDALRRACAFAGICAIFYTDRGPGYKNKAMNAPLTGFLSRAGITPMHALPYNSQAKGNVERLNQLYNASAKRLPTYVGKDMDKEAKLIVFKTTRRDIAVTGTSRLLPGWDAFLDHVEETVQGYNDRPHSELPRIRDPQLGRTRHMTPNEAWEAKLADFEPIIPDEAELDDMFRPYVVRRTRRALVDWLSNSYFAMALEPYDGQDVIVGYDIRDASRVWVREIEEIDDERVPGRLIAIAAFEGHKTRYVPVAYEQAAMEKRAKGRLGRLNRKIGVVEQELKPKGLEAAMYTYGKFGYFPRRIIAPRFSTTLSVRQKMLTVANKVRGHAITDLPPGLTKQGIVEKRGVSQEYQLGDDRLVYCAPHVMALDAVTADQSLQPLSQHFGGVWNEVVNREEGDDDGGPAASPSNRSMPDVSALEIPLYSYPGDTSSDGNFINEAGIVTADMGEFGAGIKTWGAHASSFGATSASQVTKWLHVRAMYDVLHEAILWHLVPYIDKRGTPQRVEFLEDQIQRYVNTKERDNWLYGGRFSFDRKKNTAEEILGQGRFWYRLDGAPMAIMHRISVESYIDLNLVRSALGLGGAASA